MKNDVHADSRHRCIGLLRVGCQYGYRRLANVIKKYGIKMGAFVIWWFFMGHFVIPYLLLRSDWWLFSWVTYSPLDEMIIFPIALFILCGDRRFPLK